MKLAEPITIRGTEFSNRMVMAPMAVGVGMRSRRARAYYLERARGGVGTIIMAATSVDAFARDEAWGEPGGVDALVSGLRPLVDEVHEAGTRIGVQLWHANFLPSGLDAPNGRPGQPPAEPIAVSATDTHRALTIPEIGEIISRFARASANARRAGLDFIEVHGAHGYLVCQFFSPAFNRREDEYGGDLAGRMRFGTALVSAIRTAVGDDFPVFYRLGAWEDVTNGIATDDAVRFAAALAEAGADVLDVSVGAMTGTRLTATPGPQYPEGTLVPLAESVKRRVRIPVIAVGRFRTPEVAEEVLALGKADMIAVGRQLIADPRWPEQAVTGRLRDIRPCISCNTCLEPVRAGLRLRCSVNPSAGREQEAAVQPAAHPRKVMVVGGGPGGMVAARVAAERGHQVTLYERQPQLGGQLIPASMPPYKHEIASLNEYLVRQLERSGAEVRLGATVNAQLVEKERPDVFVSAIGPVSLAPDIAGMERANVVTDLEVLSGAVETGDRVVVIGGELTGCETADYLSEEGKQVTVVRRGPEMATNVAPDLRHALLARLEDKGVTLMPGIQEYQEITPEGLALVNSHGQRLTLPADTIVLATGSTANDRLAQEVRRIVPEVHLVGDCAEPGRIIDAIHDGARVGRQI